MFEGRTLIGTVKKVLLRDAMTMMMTMMTCCLRHDTFVVFWNESVFQVGAVDASLCGVTDKATNVQTGGKNHFFFFFLLLDDKIAQPQVKNHPKTLPIGI